MKTDKTKFIINKGDLINSLINDAYNEISEKCNIKFIKSAGPYNYNDVIKYIVDELSNETLISYSTFEKYQRAFYKAIETTINKKMFVDAEIRNIKKLLTYSYAGITDFENLQNNIFDLILTNTEKEKILQHYYKKFFLKNDVDTFVKIVFSYELIEYLFFLQADPLSEQPTGKGKPPPEKPFHEYILHEKNVQIAEQLKSEFKTEKGKSIRLIIEVLIKKKMFTIENRQRQKIYDAMKKYFDRDIGTKQSIFDYKIKEISDRPDFESIEIRIDKRLSGINKTK